MQRLAIKEIAQLFQFIDDFAFISQVTKIQDLSIHIWTTQLIQLVVTNGCYQTRKCHYKEFVVTCFVYVAMRNYLKHFLITNEKTNTPSKMFVNACFLTVFLE